MKKVVVVLLPLLLVLCLVLILRTAGVWKDDSPAIVGGWETEANIINSYEDVGDAKGLCQFYFHDDLTGELVETALGTTSQRLFTYQVNGDEVSISFDSGIVWTFPYRLEGDVLVLTQNQADIAYQRIK